MVKVLVTDNKAKNVSAAIISGLKRQVNELNSAEYNYADILKSITIFTEYSKLIGTYLGIDVNIKFDIQHSSKVRLNMVNNTIPKVRLSDLNAALRSNYSILIQIVGQIESIYNKAFTDYKSMIALYDIEKVEYAKFKSESLSEIDSLMEALNNTEIITNDDIDEVLHEAQIETEAQIEEATKNTEDIAQEVWDTNKGYETSSQIQEDAMKAAEEYAENKAHEAEATEANAKLDEAKSELQEAYIDFGSAQDKYDAASTAYAEALIASQEKDATARSDGLAAVGINNAGIHSGDLPETVGGLTAGTFLSENGENIITVTHKDDGTTTITVEASDGSHSSRTYSSSDNFQSTENAVEDTARQSRAEADEAKANLDQKSSERDEALENLGKAQEEVVNANAKVDQAQQEADDASIPYATDDELENGWDGSNNTEDNYGPDGWGDWSDLASAFINSDDDDDDNTGGDDDNTGGDDDE